MEITSPLRFLATLMLFSLFLMGFVGINMNSIVLKISIHNQGAINDCIDAKDIILSAIDDLETDGKFDDIEIGAVLFQGEWTEEDIIIA